MERIISALLIVAGIVNFLPVAGVLSADMLANAYGIAAPEGDLLILMRHRALLFGVLGGIVVVAAFRRHLQPTAITAGLVSMWGFIGLAFANGDYGEKVQSIVLIDVAASLCLVAAAILRLKTAR